MIKNDSIPKDQLRMDARTKILFICGSMNQTTQMHQVAGNLDECDVYFTPFYCDGFMKFLRDVGLLETTILGKRFTNKCLAYLKTRGLPVDFRGNGRRYDLVVTCSDLIIPKNIRKSRILLIQEGMTDPETWMFRLVRRLRFIPRWIASTASTGLSDVYERFCVASEGYRDLFIKKGVSPEKIVVTGIPNFDNCRKFLSSDFSEKHYVLVCTSDRRETWNFENRRKFIEKAVRMAKGRPLVFKLHPNENANRASREIRKYAPEAIICRDGATEVLIAHCDALITRYSSTVYVGLALGKEVYSDFPIDQLKKMIPLQNDCAANNIASVCRQLLLPRPAVIEQALHRLPQAVGAAGRTLATEVMA